MKSRILHIASIVLLFSVSVSSISDVKVLTEKEHSEIEDSLEELKEGKSLYDYLDGLERTFLMGDIWIVTRQIITTGRSTILPKITTEKYLLYCSLKLCS